MKFELHFSGSSSGDGRAAMRALTALALLCHSFQVSEAQEVALDRPATTTADAVKQFEVADGLAVSLFASEPTIAQPVSMLFDDRGRMWVVQYLQYPHPAGLNPVSVDRYLRTKYDRVPEPP